MSDKVNVGIIGCGAISGIYLKNCTQVFKDIVDVVAVADIAMDRAKAKAKEFNVPKACSVRTLLAMDNVEMVINLTIPKVHMKIALAAVKAGKHVVSEKPLGLTRREGARQMEAAAAKNVRIGCAPDTFLGAGLQTCRKLIDDGAIGRPVAATAFMLCHGHEGWHPSPDFYYQPGGGPMFDMGPYYLTALINLMGPVRRVTGSAQKAFTERTITNEKHERRGQKIPVDVQTHVAGVMDFANGAVCTIITSFDVWSHNLPRIEIYGTEGTLSVPDPNTFGGPVKLRKAADQQWNEVPLTHGYAENSRGIGPADLARAARSGRKHRASGELAFHVLDIMQAFHEASEKGRHVTLSTTCERPAPLPTGLAAGALD
jgi:predicted dehydrogenase